MTEQKVNAGTRLGTMILDHVIMTFAVMIFAIPGMVHVFMKALNVSHEQPDFDFWGDTIYFMLIGFAVYFCKDSINGRSPGKRILKLQVVDNTTGEAASSIKCFFRNIFIILWPIEIIVALVNPSRRIGDFIAGTRVVVFDQSKEQLKNNWSQIGISLALAYGLMLILMTPYTLLKSRMKSERTNFIETSFNEQESEATEQLFADSLSSYLTADIRIYDKIENEDLKYVSIIFRLNENYLSDDESFDKIKTSTTKLLLSKFPERTFVGRIQYLFQSGGNMQSRTIPLDWREQNKE
jgi:uncharacterized RDD family membrane protein YckC